MSDLVWFFLGRRFKNKATLILYASIAVLLGVVAFSDILIERWMPSLLAKTAVQVINIDGDLLVAGFEDVLEIHDEADLILESIDGRYRIASLTRLSSKETAYLSSVIAAYHNRIHDSIAMIDFEFEGSSSLHNDGLYLIITAIYFMMLAFATIVANEVVLEKTTNVLELICTSVPARHHFYAKLFLGWFMIAFQSLFIVCFGLLWGWVRYGFDQGSGLLALFHRLNVLPVLVDDFGALVALLDLNMKTGLILGLSLMFLFVGILIIQVIAVIVSSRVSSIEEAGAIQGPVYMVLLGIYYVSIFMNTSQQMEAGLGWGLSFVPVFSMLLMPVRLFTYDPSGAEVLLSGLISGGFLWILLRWGLIVYEKNILERK